MQDWRLQKQNRIRLGRCSWWGARGLTEWGQKQGIWKKPSLDDVPTRRTNRVAAICIVTRARTRVTGPDIIRLALPAARSLLVAKRAVGRASQRPCAQHRVKQGCPRIRVFTALTGAHFDKAGLGGAHAMNGSCVYLTAECGDIDVGGLARLKRGIVGVAGGAVGGDKTLEVTWEERESGEKPEHVEVVYRLATSENSDGIRRRAPVACEGFSG